MKIGVLSDTHIPERAAGIPEKVIEAFKGVDMIIHAGDICEMSVLEALQKVCSDVRAVRGNMDSGEIRKKLPEKEIIQAGKFKIGVMHGYGHPNNLCTIVREAFKNDKVDIIIFGHSHAPFNEKKDGILYFNPGSSTDTIFAPYRSYGIIEIDDTIKARIVKL